MFPGNLTECVKTVVVSGNTAAGTTDVTTSAVDMSGFDAIRYLAYTGDATSGTVLTLTPYYNSANSTSGGTAITGAAATYTSASATDADNKLLVSDVIRPAGRYSYAILNRATQNCAVNGIIAELYRARSAPVTADSTVIGSGTTVQGGVAA